MAVVAVLAACAASASAPGPELGQTDGLPSATSPDDEVLEWAEQTLTGQCMVAAGFSYYVHGWRAEPVEAGRPDQNYGSDDVSWAQTYGYGIGYAPSDSSTARAANPNAVYVRGLSEERASAYALAVRGDTRNVVKVTLASGGIVTAPLTGCHPQMQDRLYGDVRRWAYLRITKGNLQVEIQPKVLADRRYTSALRSWRACMRRADAAADDPSASREAISQRYQEIDRAEAWEEEKQVAVADARCSLESGLVATARELDGVYRQRVMTDHKEDLQEYDTRRAEAVRRSRALMSTVATGATAGSG